MVLALRGLIIAVLALGLWTNAGADWTDGGGSPKSQASAIGADESSVTLTICCHPEPDHKACRFPGLHFSSESLIPKESELDQPPNVVLHNIWEIASYSLYASVNVNVARSNHPTHNGSSIYLTTLRLRL